MSALTKSPTMLRIWFVLGVLTSASSVIVGPGMLGKGIAGPGKTCGHQVYTKLDFKYGQYETICTRWILCEGRTDCLSAGVDSVQACAEAAWKANECEGDLIESRLYNFQNGEISHCFCNPKGVTWTPNTAHAYSVTFTLKEGEPTTTLPTTTTEHPLYSEVDKLTARIVSLETKLAQQDKSFEDAQDNFDELVVAREVDRFDLQQRLTNMTKDHRDLAELFTTTTNDLRTDVDGTTASVVDALASIKALAATVSSATPVGDTSPLVSPTSITQSVPSVSTSGADLLFSAASNGVVEIVTTQCGRLDVCEVAKRIDAISTALKNLK